MLTEGDLNESKSELLNILPAKGLLLADLHHISAQGWKAENRLDSLKCEQRSGTVKMINSNEKD